MTASERVGMLETPDRSAKFRPATLGGTPETARDRAFERRKSLHDAAVGWLVLALAVLATPATASQGELAVAIETPAAGNQLQRWETEIDVTGGASVFGGVKHLDLVLVLDSSKSLQSTDEDDYRKRAAIALVRNLSKKSDIRFGAVEFDDEATLVSPLTTDREAVASVLQLLDRSGGTDLAEGIELGLSAFSVNARPDTTRVMLLFTDGKSNEKKALAAMEKAREMQVIIHTMLLGSASKGERILSRIAAGTGGAFVRVEDPSKLPEAFLALRTTGIERVTLAVDGGAPLPATLEGGRFHGRVPLRPGENRISATATSLDGRTATDTVIVSGPLGLSIETPADGTVYVDRETRAIVEGTLHGISDPSPEYLARYPNHGVDRVDLWVDEAGPFPAALENGRFRGPVTLRVGPNRIRADAFGRHGGEASDAGGGTVRPTGCAQLDIASTREGAPTVSISDRAIEIVVDASNSMWGQIGGQAKIGIAKATLADALDWLPADLSMALRVYGHQSDRSARNCTDSELLVPPGSGNRERIREAIEGFRPKGQTPLAYSLEQIGADLGGFEGERAVVLVTDGIESCGGDPSAAARELRAQADIPVHVIGFGLGSDADADLASLRAIAEASGGRFLTAGNADELREALRSTAGTSYRGSRDGATIATGTLGIRDVFRLPQDDYVVAFDSKPPYEVPVSLRSEESLTLAIARRGGAVTPDEFRMPADYFDCEAPSVPSDDPWAAPAAERRGPEGLAGSHRNRLP